MLDITKVPSDYTDTYATWDNYLNWWVASEDFYLTKLGVSLTTKYSTEAQANVIRNWVAQFSKDYLFSTLPEFTRIQLEYLLVKDPDYRKAILDFQVELMKSTLYVGGIQEMMKVRDRVEQIAPAAYNVAKSRGLFNRYYRILNFNREDYITERNTW